MGEFNLPTVTSTTLLEGLKDPANDTIWLQFVDRYRPLIMRYSRRLGLAEEDAEDVAQASLLGFCEAYRNRKYKRDRGRLRSWLFGIVHNNVRSWRSKGRGREVQVSDTEARRFESDDDFERLWEEEWTDAVARECMAHVRRELERTTYEAFKLYALQEVPVEEVARRLDMTPNAVYGAKRRALARLREIQPLIEDVW